MAQEIKFHEQKEGWTDNQRMRPVQEGACSSGRHLRKTTMPRTVETIVANHQLASALRAAGKPIWPRRVDIKVIIREDQTSEDPAVIASKANRIASLLRRHLPTTVFDCTNPKCDFDFVDAVEMMEECTVASLATDLENGVEAVEMLNGWLETVYDWADAQRVWLGH